MNAQRLKVNSIEGLILFCLFSIMCLESFVVSAQSNREMLDRKIAAKAKAWENDSKKIKQKKLPTYIGGEASLSVQQYTLKSNIPALSELNAKFLGTNVGGVVGNSRGKIKANAGLYYSEDSMPYDMDMIQGNITASAYLLRLKKITYHLFEPYFSMGLSYQITKFYGYYLPTSQNGASTQRTNYSTTDQPLLSSMGFTLMTMITGVEYQLENSEDQFIHLFGEVSYGMMVHSSSSNKAFNSTTITNPSAITVGINFGILR